MGRVAIERPAPVAGRDADIRTYPVKAGESVVAGDVVDVVGGAVTVGRVPVGSLAVGSVVKLNVGGKPTEFIVVQHGKPSSIYSSTFTGNTILMMKDCYESRQWHNGSMNSYAISAIHDYLNGAFLIKLDAGVQANIREVKIPYCLGAGGGTTVTSGESGLSAKVWLPSTRELGLTGSDTSDSPDDGAKFSYFLSGVLEVARVRRLCYLNGKITQYWTRSPFCESSWGSSAAIYTNGNGGVGDTCSVERGIRPVLALPDTFSAYIPKIIPSQAIALQSGTGGQSIDVIFDGTAELPGITAGTTITSPGVQGYAPQDGWLWVKPEWEQQMGVRVVSGSYLGTGTYGTNAPNALTFDFTPKIVFVLPTKSTAGNVVRGGRLMLLYGSTVALNDDCNYPVPSTSRDFYGYTLIVSWDENSVKWFSSENAIGQNNEGTTTYYYVAIG